MRPDLIIKNRKLNHIIGVIGIILSIIIIFLALKNLSWLYRLVGVCAIIYYLIDIEQKLEEEIQTRERESLIDTQFRF